LVKWLGGCPRTTISQFVIVGARQSHNEDFASEEFYRAPQADGKIREGTGMGLPSSRRLVESLGGVIDCVSEPGKGSTFTAWLPSARE
jgi:signal transduction histidine kinase